MTKNEIIERVQEKFDGLVLNENWGEVGLFYNPTYKLSKGIYLLTFKEKDGANDKASNVNREGVFRLNLGISKETFIKRFDEIPKLEFGIYYNYLKRTISNIYIEYRKQSFLGHISYTDIGLLLFNKKIR